MSKFILASSSPRRKELLYKIGFIPDVIHSPDIDETPLPNELPSVLAKRLAYQKALKAYLEMLEIHIDTKTTDIVFHEKTQDFYEKLFGKRYNKTTYLLDNKTKLYNGCAGKVSTALALSGCYIQKTGGIGIDFIASENTLKSKSLNNVTNKNSKNPFF